MKKLLYLYLLSISMMLPVSLSAQHTLQKSTNAPRTGDEFIKEEVPYQAVENKKTDPDKATGKLRRIWDFSNLNPIKLEKTYTIEPEPGKTEKVTEYKEEHSVRYFFRGEEEGFLSAEDNRLYSFKFSGDSLLDYGREDFRTLIKYHEPSLVLRFPFTYGAVHKSSFRGRGKSDGRLQSVHMGTLTSQTDAFGSLVLPGRDTLKYVVRLHIRKEEQTYYSLLPTRFDIDAPVDSDSLLKAGGTPDMVITDTYQWYEEGYRYPVFETVESYRIWEKEEVPLQLASYIYYPADQAFLKEDKENEAILKARQAVREVESQGGSIAKSIGMLRIKCYPNPVKDNLIVELDYHPETETLLGVYSFDGKELYRTSVREKQGFSQISIPMSSYAVGAYLLRIISGEEQCSEIVVKE